MNIKEIENNYTIGRGGTIYNLKSKKYMTHNVCRNGYHRVHLTLNGKRKAFSVHRLVALKFNSNNYFNGAEINHIDGDKSNNAVENLEWVTHKENINHAVKDLGVKLGTQKGKLRNKMIKELSKKFTQHEIAEVFNCSQANISRLLK